jgi:hypothetical protein
MWLVLIIALLLAWTQWPQTEGFTLEHKFKFDVGLPKLDAFSSTAKFVRKKAESSKYALINSMPFKEHFRQWRRKIRS